MSECDDRYDTTCIPRPELTMAFWLWLRLLPEKEMLALMDAFCEYYRRAA